MKAREKRKKGRAGFLAILWLAFFLCTGCSSVNLNPESLMSPPLVTEDQSQIMELIQKDSGTNGAIMRYPRSGITGRPLFLRILPGTARKMPWRCTRHRKEPEQPLHF